jgi:hypothetical protein
MHRHAKLLFGILVRTVVLAVALGLCSDRLARWTPIGGSESTYRESAPRELDVVPRAARWHAPVAPAPLLKRLPVPAAPIWNGTIAAAQRVWAAPESIAPSCAGVGLVRVTRHVPRMDCGEPPRA